VNTQSTVPSKASQPIPGTAIIASGVTGTGGAVGSAVGDGLGVAATGEGLGVTATDEGLGVAVTGEEPGVAGTGVATAEQPAMRRVIAGTRKRLRSTFGRLI
jgi:hypothetical protein